MKILYAVCDVWCGKKKLDKSQNQNKAESQKCTSRPADFSNLSGSYNLLYHLEFWITSLALS